MSEEDSSSTPPKDLIDRIHWPLGPKSRRHGLWIKVCHVIYHRATVAEDWAPWEPSDA
jgi:hypothetical protein